MNWATSVDLKTAGRSRIREADVGLEEHQGHPPLRHGWQDQQPVAFSPKTSLFHVPSNNLCMDYRRRGEIPGGPAVRRRDRGEPRRSGRQPGRFLAWDPNTGKRSGASKENLAAWGGALATGGDVVFYGTMEGWLKAVNAKTGDVCGSSSPVGNHRQPDDLRRPG